LPRSLLIHTYLQIGDDGGRKFPEPFQRFATSPETVQTVSEAPNVSDTQLKQGVNEKSLRQDEVSGYQGPCAIKLLIAEGEKNWLLRK